MADKAQLEELIKKKLAELEVSNPTLSEEEAKKQKEELRAELKPAKDIFKDESKSIGEKIKLLYNLALEYAEKETETEIEFRKVNRKMREAQKERDEAYGECNRADKEREALKLRCMELQKRNKEVQDINGKLDTEEENKRKEIRADFEKAIREFKAKVSGEVNEADLKAKNEQLKAEMQKIMEDNKKHTEELEQKIKEKQKNSEAVQEKLKVMMQTKFEELLSDSTKEKKTQIELLQKEQELKAQISMYETNFDQLEDSIKKSGPVFSQFKKELRKKGEMLKSVERQRTELMKIKDSFDAELVELRERVNKLNEEKEKIKEECQSIQKGMAKA